MRFLVAAATALRAAGAHPELVGVDVHPDAVCAALANLAAAGFAESSTVALGDALTRDWAEPPFDVVVGNPPYLSPLASTTAPVAGGAAGPYGDVAVYVAHLPSVRVKFDAGFTAGQRDHAADALGQAIAGETLHSVLLLGDLNGTMNDRSLAPVTSQMRSAQGAAGDGFGFSWPASFPMARIDQIMVRGVAPVSAWTLPRTGSDHLPVAASVKL